MSIESPRIFTLKDEKVQAVIRAKYSHGKLVRGFATVTITTNIQHPSTYSEQWKKKKYVVAKKLLNFEGQETIEFGIKNELKLDKSFLWKEEILKIEAEIIDDSTGLVQTGDRLVIISKNTHEINFQEVSELERGIPFHFKVCFRYYINYGIKIHSIPV